MAFLESIVQLPCFENCMSFFKIFSEVRTLDSCSFLLKENQSF